jgi:hypothetical protein
MTESPPIPIADKSGRSPESALARIATNSTAESAASAQPSPGTTTGSVASDEGGGR